MGVDRTREEPAVNATQIHELAPQLETVGEIHGLEVPESLSKDARKRVIFGADVYFREGWADAQRILGDRAPEVLSRHGLVLLKPDAVARRVLDPAIDWFETREAAIVVAEQVSVSTHAMRAMWQYQMNAASPDRLELADRALVTDAALVIVARLPESPVPASVRFSSWKGPADPRRRQPGELRHALAGGNFLLNYVHAADEPADVLRELTILFPGRAEREAVLRALAAAPEPGQAGRARRHARALEERIEPHDLELSTALAYLRAGVPDGPSAAAFLSLLDAVEAGETRDWRALWRAADDAGVPSSRWDRAVVGTHLAEHTTPGVRPILSSVPAELWEQAAAEARSTGPDTLHPVREATA